MVDWKSPAKLANLLAHLVFDNAVVLGILCKTVENVTDQVADLHKLGGAEATCRTGRRTETDTGRHHRRCRVEWHAVLVAGDAGILERYLGDVAGQALRAQIDQDKMRVCTAGNDIDATPDQCLAKNPGIRHDKLDIGPEFRTERLTEAGRLAGDGMDQRTTLKAREDRRVDLLSKCLVIRQDDAAAPGAQRLVRRRGDDMRMRHRIRMDAGGDQPRDVCHIDHQVGVDSIRDFTELGEIEGARIGRAASQNDLRLAGLRLVEELVEINLCCFLVNAVLLGVEPLDLEIKKG